MKTITTVLSLLLMFLQLNVHAAPLPDLYAGEVPVADESPEIRSEALQEILRQVMVRVSGTREVLAAPAVAQVLREAGALVQKFRYRSEEFPSGNDDPVQKRLHARFDPAALHRVMARHSLPVWLAQRPRVLVWVASEDRGVRELLNIGEDREIQGLLRDRAQARGMPLQLPLLDLEDRAAITAADVWSGYADAIKQASARYPHDAILSGRLRSLGGARWSGDWRLWREDRYLEMNAGGGALQEVLAAGIDLAQDQLARGAATTVVARTDLTRVLVEGVNGLEAYSRLMRIFGGVAEIESLVVLEASSEGLLLGAQVTGGRDRLARGLDASAELVRLPLAGGMRLPAEGADVVPWAQTADLAYRTVGMGPLE